MKELLDSFWRAAAYCLHPRVILWSLLPLLFAVGLVFGLGWFFWESSVAAVRALLEQWSMVVSFLEWLNSVGAAGFRVVLAPLIVVALAVPVIVVASLLLVAWFMTPALVGLVASRRFESLERKRGASWFTAVMWSIGCMLVGLLLLGLSLPLWFIPPLVLILPPLIWGWMTYKVMSFDVLVEHASRDERRQLLSEQRWPLLAIGITTGYLGAAPSLLWAVSAATLVLAPVLVVLSVWLYTLVFAFSSLWFAHFALAALQRLRLENASGALPEPALTTLSPMLAPMPAAAMLELASPSRVAAATNFGLVIVGDEILSGKRQDKHLAKVVELLGARGLTLAWARYAGDDRAQIASVLSDAFASGEVVFSCGGIGATPDDHTRQAAAAALGVPLVLHPGARELIVERMRDVAAEQGLPFEPDRQDNQHRLNMGTFPEGAQLIPNPYNKIPGFSVGSVHFLPGFPVMAWPMIEWVLDTHYKLLQGRSAQRERSVIVYGSMEATLTPLMEEVEQGFAGIKVFSLPCVDEQHLHGRHIELGVKGPALLVDDAFVVLRKGLDRLSARCGPEMARN